MKVKIDRRTLFGLVAEHCNIALSVRDFPTEITLEATPIPDTEECNNCGCLEMTHPIGECKEFVSKHKEPTEKHSCRKYGWPKKDCTYCMNPKKKEPTEECCKVELTDGVEFHEGICPKQKKYPKLLSGDLMSIDDFMEMIKEFYLRSKE